MSANFFDFMFQKFHKSILLH